MINVAAIRAAAAAAPGPAVAIGKDQLETLLAELAEGQAARRALKMLRAVQGIEPATAPVMVTFSPAKQVN